MKPQMTTILQRTFPGLVWVREGVERNQDHLGGGDVGEAVDGGGLQELPQDTHPFQQQNSNKKGSICFESNCVTR